MSDIIVSEVAPEVKISAFRFELDLIEDLAIKEFTELCLIAAPDYIFLDCPASSSGKFHPIDELGWDGVIIHTRKVVSVGYDLARGLDTADRQDEIVSACIIHDLRKQGITKKGYTQNNHPKLAADLVAEVHFDTGIITNTSFEIIRSACGYHYGPWSKAPWLKPLDQYTPTELAVYMADYIASRKGLTVNYLTREWN